MMIACRGCNMSQDFVTKDRVPDSCPLCGLDWRLRVPTSADEKIYRERVAREGSAWINPPEMWREPGDPPPGATVTRTDFEFGPLARYLDAHPGRHASVMRHDGKWVIRVGAALGFGHTLAEASASACNALFVEGNADPFSPDALARAARATMPTEPGK